MINNKNNFSSKVIKEIEELSSFVCKIQNNSINKQQMFKECIKLNYLLNKYVPKTKNKSLENSLLELYVNKISTDSLMKIIYVNAVLFYMIYFINKRINKLNLISFLFLIFGLNTYTSCHSNYNYCKSASLLIDKNIDYMLEKIKSENMLDNNYLREYKTKKNEYIISKDTK